MITFLYYQDLNLLQIALVDYNISLSMCRIRPILLILLIVCSYFRILLLLQIVKEIERFYSLFS